MKNIVFILCLWCTIACNKEAAMPEQAQIKFINAAINAPKLELTFDGVLVVKDVSFPAASRYAFVNAGTPNIRVAASDGPNTGIVYASNNFSLLNNTNYTIIATDSVNKMKVSIVQDTIINQEPGKAKIRFFHLANNSYTNVSLAVGTNVITTQRNFNDQSNNQARSAFSLVDAATVTLFLKDSLGNTLTTMPNVTLQQGKLYTCILKGTSGAAINTPQALNMILLPYN